MIFKYDKHYFLKVINFDGGIFKIILSMYNIMMAVSKVKTASVNTPIVTLKLILRNQNRNCDFKDSKRNLEGA